jgi:hypothetical protein
MDLFADIPDAANAGAAQGATAGTDQTAVSKAYGYPQHGPGADVSAAYNAVSPYIPEYLKEGARSLYEGPRNMAQNFARDTGPPTLKGLSGAATKALSVPVRTVFGQDAGFGTAVDAVMNPLTAGQWGDRAERFYDPVEQRFNHENEGIVAPVNAAMEGSLSTPYGLAGHTKPGEPRSRATDLFADIPDVPTPKATGAPQAAEARLGPAAAPLGQQSALSAGERQGAADVFRRSYGDQDGALAKLLDSPDNYSRNLGQALLESAPQYEEGRTLAAAGKMRPEDDHTPHILRAVEFIKGLREADIAPSDYWQGHESKHEPDQAAGRWVSILYRGRDLEDPNLSQKINYGLGFHAPYETQPIAKRRAADATPVAPLVRAIGDRLENSPAFKLDPEWLKQATANDPVERFLAKDSLDAGRPYDIDPHAHDSTVSVMSDFENRLPAGVKIGVLNRVEPTSDPNVVKGLFSDAPDFANYVRRDFVRDAAGVWDPGTRAILVSRYGTNGFRSFGHFAEGLQGEIHHELVHAVSALDLTAAQRNALLNDANAVGALDVPFHLYSALKRSSPPSQWESQASLRDTYRELYKDREPAMRQFLIEEEAIAIMGELYHHGVIDPKDLSPVSRSVLDRILNTQERGPAILKRPKPARQASTAGSPSQAEPARNIVLSHEDYQSRAPAEVQHFRQLPFENEPDWHNPVDLLKERTAREDRLARYANQAHPAVLSRWRDELRTINDVASTLPPAIRAAAEAHLRNNWQSYFDRPPRGLSRSRGGAVRVKQGALVH